MVVMGITPTFVEILGEPHKISLPPVGTSMSAMDTFGSIEGYKISADLITPVSGGVFEFDEYVAAQSADGGQIGQINEDPYNNGWLIVVQLSKPGEINSLLSPQAYLKLITK
jgi:glycine cleavage system H protein